MPPSPTSPDSGIYVDSTNQASEDLVSNFVWSSQAVGYLSDGTMLLCMSGNGAYTDSLYFYYSEDNGASWTRCSTFITPSNAYLINTFNMIISNEDVIFVSTQDSLSNDYLYALTFSAGDITAVAKSSSLAVATKGMSLYCVDDPGTGSSYDKIIYVQTGASGSLYVYGYTTGTSFTYVTDDSTIGYDSAAAVAWVPWQAGGSQPYDGGANDVAYMVQGEGPGGTINPLQVIRYAHASTTSWTATFFEEIPTGWSSTDADSFTVGTAYDSTSDRFYLIRWDSTYGGFRVAYQTPSSWNSSWTLGTPVVDDATRGFSSTYSYMAPRTAFDKANRKIYVYYGHNTAPDYMMWNAYNIATDTWDGWTAQETSQVVLQTLAMGGAASASGGTYNVGMLFIMRDDSTVAEWLVFDSLDSATGGGASYGWGIAL